MFTRDGSLIRKKQQQWAREKEEREREKDWFPFGENNSPGGGNPTRRHEARDYFHDYERGLGNANVPSFELRDSGLTHEANLPCPAANISSLETDHCNMREKEVEAPQNTQFLPQYQMPVQPYPLPFSPEYWQGISAQRLQLAYPPIPVPFHMIPPGAIPIPPPMMVPTYQEGGTPSASMTPIYTPEQWNQYLVSLQSRHPKDLNVVSQSEKTSIAGNVVESEASSQMQETMKMKPLATAIVYPLPTPILIPEDNKASSCQVSPILPMIVDFRQNPTTSESSHRDLQIDEQIEEKRRQQMEMAEKSRLEEEKILVREREEKERHRLLEEQHKLEAEKREEHKREQIYQQVLESIERAKKDAELTKKAKIYRHIMEGQPEQEKMLLGEDGSRILKEVNALERHRQIEKEQLAAAKSPAKDNETHHSISHHDIRPIRSSLETTDRESSSLVRGGMRASLRTRPTQRKPSVTTRSNSAERNRTFTVENDLKKATVGMGSPSLGSRIPWTNKLPSRTSKVPNQPLHDRELDPLEVQISTTSITDEGNTSPVNLPVTSDTSFREMVESPTRTDGSEGFNGPLTSTPKSSKFSKHAAEIRRLPDQPARRTAQRPSSLDPQALLFSYTPIRRGNKMRVSTESAPNDVLRGSVDSNDASSSGSASPSRPQSQRSPSIPSINVQDSDTENRCTNNHHHEKVYSIAESPVAHLGRPRTGTHTPLFHKRLGELGASKNLEQDLLSPEARRLAEQRFPSMERLRMSSLNLATTDDSIKNRPASPLLDQFKSRAPQYRSFTLKKNSDKQAAILERLNAMRDRLHEKDSIKERSSNVPRFGSANSTRGQRT